MRTTSFAKVAALCGLLALSGCASKITQPDKYSGFLNNYSDLKETTSATGKPVLRWVDPSFDQSKYDSIVWNPITYYPVPKPSTQVGDAPRDKRTYFREINYIAAAFQYQKKNYKSA
ncbi:DUF3313 family protein [Escherichia coli]